ncbi:MAG TPA: hypothetical protein VIH92_04290 [Solirubrobacteraceae bacterium]
MRHKRSIIIACGLLAAAAVLAAVLAQSTTSHGIPMRVAGLRATSNRGICSTAEAHCVSGCLLPVAAVIVPTPARAGECPPASRSSRPCRLLIANDQHPPTTSDDSFCAREEVLLRRLRERRARHSPRALR